jgi:CDGSH-type Zn-finger protein
MPAAQAKKGRIRIVKDGPYLVSGNVPLATAIVKADDEGTPVKWEIEHPYPDKETYALCRCGQSKNKPFCDGTHVTIGFKAVEEKGGK